MYAVAEVASLAFIVSVELEPELGCALLASFVVVAAFMLGSLFPVLTVVDLLSIVSHVSMIKGELKICTWLTVSNVCC